MADFSVKMTGVDELSKKLEALSYDMKKKGGRYALRKAAQIIRDQAKLNALALNDPRTSEVIAKNITEKWNGRLNKQTGDLGFRVGVLGGARDYSAYGELKTGKSASDNPGGDTFYWRFLEFGTEKAAARPFLRPAMDAAQKATDTFIAEYGKSIDRAMKRAGK
jgi:HK97 gp10 family phage protein